MSKNICHFKHVLFQSRTEPMKDLFETNLITLTASTYTYVSDFNNLRTSLALKCYLDHFGPNVKR